jgi:probable rRNA maturation factor
MNELIDIQHASSSSIPVSDDTLVQWVHAVLPPAQQHAELTLRFVDADEMIALNTTYRQQEKTTNVLAFPSELPAEIILDNPFLGDIIICPEVLAAEHLTLQISLVAHWAHIVIHGVLHLLGFDHQGIDDTQEMQAIEISTLKTLGFANPYALNGDE